MADDDFVSEDDSLEAEPPGDFLGPGEQEPVTYAPRGAFMSELEKLRAASGSTPEELANFDTIEEMKRSKWRRRVDRILRRPFPPNDSDAAATGPHLLHRVAEEERAEKPRD